ncbi:MAG: hypothetical protein KDJ77_15130 [Rhodobiaceae bacterium]|nr:hypothetical protein [Rhodobiaceae bacterium]
MPTQLRLSGFFHLVALTAFVLLVWRGMEMVTSGQLVNPLGRIAMAQDAPAEAADPAQPDGTDSGAMEAPASEAAADGAAPAPESDKPKRLTASDIKRMRSTDVTENMGKDGGPVASEQTVLMRLGERRDELDKREEDLNMREKLIEAAEKRVEERVRELKQIEARINEKVAEKPEEEDTSLVNIVAMYEQMKPKDAARIFNTLDLNVLVSVAEKMKPRTMSAVLAAMEAKAAQRLTLALARREAEKAPAMADTLPKIGSDG